jgi:predicted DNA-binding transcriptional regulator AlpA
MYEKSSTERRLGSRRVVATILGQSLDTVRRMEKTGVLPKPIRLTPTSRPLHDLERIRELVARAAGENC